MNNYKGMLVPASDIFRNVHIGSNEGIEVAVDNQSANCSEILRDENGDNYFIPVGIIGITEYDAKNLLFNGIIDSYIPSIKENMYNGIIYVDTRIGRQHRQSKIISVNAIPGEVYLCCNF